MILRATVAGAVINTAANFLLIPRLRQDGAAAASVLSELTVTALLLWYAKDCYRIRASRNYLAGAAVGMRALFQGTSGSVLVVIAVSALCYAVCLLVFRNELLMELIQKLKAHKESGA